jgi:hypothetical protein
MKKVISSSIKHPSAESLHSPTCDVGRPAFVATHSLHDAVSLYVRPTSVVYHSLLGASQTIWHMPICVSKRRQSRKSRKRRKNGKRRKSRTSDKLFPRRRFCGHCCRHRFRCDKSIEQSVGCDVAPYRSIWQQRGQGGTLSPSHQHQPPERRVNPETSPFRSHTHTLSLILSHSFYSLTSHREHTHLNGHRGVVEGRLNVADDILRAHPLGIRATNVSRKNSPHLHRRKVLGQLLSLPLPLFSLGSMQDDPNFLHPLLFLLLLFLALFR